MRRDDPAILVLIADCSRKQVLDSGMVAGDERRLTSVLVPSSTEEGVGDGFPTGAVVRPLDQRMVRASPIHWEPSAMNVHTEVFAPRTSIHPFGHVAEFIEGQIERRAGGQIRDLHVVLHDGEIILQGRTKTYHAKQLAQQAVLDAHDGFDRLVNSIVVS